MNKDKAEDIVVQLLTNATGLQYGSVSVTLKLHNGQVVSITYTKTELTRENEPKQDNDQ
jgi:hypothetical protein